MKAENYKSYKLSVYSLTLLVIVFFREILVFIVPSLQTHHLYFTLKQRGNGCFFSKEVSLNNNNHGNPCGKSVRIFPHLYRIRRDLSKFNPNAGKYRPEKL